MISQHFYNYTSHQFPNGLLLEVRKESILTSDVEIITNAANTLLSHGGGIALAISNAAGPGLQQCCDERIRTRGQLRTSEFCLTPSFNLTQFKSIAHVVGPIYDSRLRQKNIEELYTGIFDLLVYCDNFGYKSIAIPAVSSAIYGFPKKLCSETIIRAIKDFQNK